MLEKTVSKDKVSKEKLSLSELLVLILSFLQELNCTDTIRRTVQKAKKEMLDFFTNTLTRNTSNYYAQTFRKLTYSTINKLMLRYSFQERFRT